jgi:hypothetical protein
VTEVLLPWNPQDLVEPPKNTDLRIVVAGLTGKVAYTNGTRAFAFTGWGLGKGPSYIDVRKAKRIFQVDLNATDGRLFDVLASFKDHDVSFALKPRFDLALAFKLALVNAEFKDPQPAHFLDETYRVQLDPISRGQTVEFAPGPGDSMKIIAGALTVSTSKAGVNPVVARSGQCVSGKDAAPGEHPVLGSVWVGSCDAVPMSFQPSTGQPPAK